MAKQGNKQVGNVTGTEGNCMFGQHKTYVYQKSQSSISLSVL
jgi:hypothetical protein